MKRNSSAGMETWLISPDGNCCYRFHSHAERRFGPPLIYADIWFTNGKAPTGVEKRNQLTFDDALELCGQMLLDDWEKLGTHSKESQKCDLTEGLKV